MYLDQRIVVIPLSEQIISCSKVTDYSEQAGCYRVLAENTKDSSLCDRIIQDPSKYNFREECYYSIASITQDPQICNKIYSIPIKINCCNQIQDSSKKAICS